MKGKVIGVFIVLDMMLIGTVNVSATPELSTTAAKESDIFKTLQKFEDTNVTLGSEFVIISGPVSKLYSQVNIIDGPEKQKQLIERFVNRRPTLLGRILPYYPVFVEGLNFSVEFKRVPRFMESRFGYYSLNCSVRYDENDENYTFQNLSYKHNVIHKIQVTKFTGLFYFFRGRIIRGVLRGRIVREISPNTNLFFTPARFAFIGVSDDVSYLPVPL